MFKLIPHLQGQPELTTEATEIIRTAPFQYVKGIDVDTWHTADMFPNKEIIARLFIPGGDNSEQPFMWGGVAGAKNYAQMLLPRYNHLKHMGVRFVEGPNEPPVWDHDFIPPFIDFSRAWMDEMVKQGFTPIVGNFSNGWPKTPQVEEMLSLFQHISDVGAWYGCHEYAAPTMQKTHYPPDNQGEYDWTGRHKRTIATLRALNVPVPPIFIGECGLDGYALANKNPPAPEVAKMKRGWKEWGAWWRDEYQVTDARAFYQSQLMWYNDLLAPEVVAASVFTTFPFRDWANFDIDGDFLRWMAAQCEPIPHEWLPDDETATDLPTLQDKCRWGVEEALRQHKAGNVAYFLRIMEGLIRVPDGLLYRAENSAKGQ